MPRRFFEIRGRRLTRFEALAESLAGSKPGAWLFVHVVTVADRRLLPLSRGRWSLSGPRQKVGLLSTTGARSGQPRTTPLQFVEDGPRLLLVASAGGAPADPAWAHTLRANPDCGFLFGGLERRYRAHVATGDVRLAAWSRVVDWYAGYAAYQLRTGGREIPVFVLDPVSGPA
ncbi:MAG TPA: nitroreductase/quinone reductase family protein [Mycobacteriales bacterium]|nr:nitroreductase/quinone reductase family protein [Mycobacteriales bacterium]